MADLIIHDDLGFSGCTMTYGLLCDIELNQICSMISRDPIQVEIHLHIVDKPWEIIMVIVLVNSDEQFSSQPVKPDSIMVF